MRVTLRFNAMLFLGLLLPALAGAQQDRGAANAAFREGRYDEAVSLAEAALRAEPADEPARRTLVRTLIEIGRYEEAASAASGLPFLRGEALRAQGRLAEAERAFREAIDAGAADLLPAELSLAELLYNRGEREEALRRFDGFITIYNRSDRLGSEDLTAVGSAVRYLGISEPQLFQDAVRALDEAITADRGNLEPYVRLGELFLDKYNSPEAQEVLGEALSLNANHPRALLGLARARAFDGDRGRALELVRQSLEVNPDLVPARLFLARMHLDAEDHEAAEAEVRGGLEVDSSSLGALAMLAAIHYVRGERSAYEEILERVRHLNPLHGDLHTTVAEIAAQHRLYADAAVLAEEATRLDPQAWSAFGVLGLNQFRLGRIEEARVSLERSFAGDPYSVWIKNNLDLLDTFSNYEERRAPGFIFMLHRDEADLLQPYVEELAAEAHASLAQRYGDQPRGDIRIELYPRSADFSVRTVGLAGLGALGVAFGDVLALDSPAARQSGSFNWATTFWHEMAHTITMGVSANRVPRWLTEGISVLEERRARPSWGRRTTPEFVMVYRAGELPPVSRLSEGFLRPRTPQHLGHAYHLASLVAQWIEEVHGFDALVRMLHGYRDGRGNEEILRMVFGHEPEAVDAEFAAWLDPQVDEAAAHEYLQRLAAGRRYLSESRLPEARSELEAAAALFPIGGGASPYALLAQIHLQEGDERAAAEALTRLTEVDENAYGANLELARILEGLDDQAGAAAALERAVWIYPYEPAPHVKLAELYGSLGEYPKAVRERRAVVALRPVDRAEAFYQLAAALLLAGDREGARREVLRALEVAPGYDRAQDLLLRIHEER